MDASEVAQQVLRQQNDNREALRVLLDQAINQQNVLPVLQGQMGETTSFSTTVTLAWARENLTFAHNLPLFEQKKDPETHKLAIDKETIHLLSQRPLDWSRQWPMAQYLLARKNHKYPPILAVLTDSWVDELEADQWTQDGYATVSAANFTPMDNEGRLGLLSISPTNRLYALDGQHRLLSIVGALDFADTGTLIQYDSERKKQLEVLTKQDFFEEYPDISDVDLQALRSEKIGIEIIVSVMPGDTREEARRRIRSIFVHVNRLATQLGKSQLAMLDEDDGFKILAKQLATEHSLLQEVVEDNKPIPRVEWNRASLIRSSPELTTLEALSRMCRHYLDNDPKFKSWIPQVRGLVPLRPDEEEIQDGKQLMDELLDAFGELPTLQLMKQGKYQPKEIREFGEGSKGSLLARPLGQVVLAKAVGQCHFEKKISLVILFEKLSQFDADGGFDHIDQAGSYWFGIATSISGKMRDAGENLAAELLRYLCGGLMGAPEEIDSLAERIKAARTIDDFFYNMQGQKQSLTESLALPPILP